MYTISNKLAFLGVLWFQVFDNIHYKNDSIALDVDQDRDEQSLNEFRILVLSKGLIVCFQKADRATTTSIGLT